MVRRSAVDYGSDVFDGGSVSVGSDDVGNGDDFEVGGFGER